VTWMAADGLLCVDLQWVEIQAGLLLRGEVDMAVGDLSVGMGLKV
jgi:hypothetical protein